MEYFMNTEEKIRYFQEKYYNDNPEISDAEFDALWDKLSKEDPSNKLLKDIGITTWEGFEKTKHMMVMGSQDKFNNEDDFRHWLKVKKIEFPIILEYKLDGISVELQYENGKLLKAVTRGDGETGDDITANVIKMSGVPKQIDDRFTGAVRGEILLKNTVFKKYFEDAKNPRNMASGIAKRKDGKDSEHLSVIVYDAYTEEDHFITEIDKVAFLEKNNFEVVIYHVCNSANDVLKVRDHIVEIRDSLDVAIDGIVLKQDIIVESDAQRKRPEYQRAFKFETDQDITRIIDIKWSRNGYNYTPVAILEPVDLMGSTIQKASLANIDNISKLDVHIGDDVLIHKSGEIIPQILKVVKQGDIRCMSLPPGLCEVCGEELTVTGTRVYCPNLDCGGRKFHRLQKWIAKTGVKGFGPALMNYLFDNGFVTTIQDFYTVDIKHAISETNLKKSLEKAFTNLYKVNELPLETFISGFDIEGIGEGVVKFAVDGGYDSLEKLYHASVSDFAAVEGFSEGRATLLHDAMEKLYEEMNELTAFVEIKGVENEVAGKLNKASFCFTGKLEKVKRAEAQEMVTANGGVVSGGVSKDLDFLVTNTPDSGSAKNKKAQAFGTKLITEEEFLELIRKMGLNDI
jgi:DNA ligase (NAD+)